LQADNTLFAIHVELSNNLVEKAIRPVALGQKNYMFKGSEVATQRGAVTYSIIATAKQHGNEPHKYIKTILEKQPNEKSNNFE
jgi:transposase